MQLLHCSHVGRHGVTKSYHGDARAAPDTSIAAITTNSQYIHFASVSDSAQDLFSGSRLRELGKEIRGCPVSQLAIRGGGSALSKQQLQEAHVGYKEKQV